MKIKIVGKTNISHIVQTLKIISLIYIRMFYNLQQNDNVNIQTFLLFVNLSIKILI